MRNCRSYPRLAHRATETADSKAVMLDFTSALYLGLRHASSSLRPWSQLTSGRSAVQGTCISRSQQRVTQALANLIGCEQAVLGPSTLHLFWDLFGMLARDRVAIYLDAAAYPIARWGVERAAARGVPVRTFAHHNPEALARLLGRNASDRCKPLIVADGFCPGCGGAAPLAGYLEAAREHGGRLILDDTQALGILGHAPGPQARYGRGGGGSLRWNQVDDPDVIVVSSLAKGFGAPVALLAGSKAMVERFEAESETRVHCSPPSAAVVSAAEHALWINHTRGDDLRSYLARLVFWFRRRLAVLGLSPAGGLFPVQTLRPVVGFDTTRIHRHLLQSGIGTVLHRPREGLGARISVLITAGHKPHDINRAAQLLAGIFDGRRHATTLERDYENLGLGFGIV